MPLDFMTHFTGLRDPRDDKNKRHALMDILFLNVAAVISGADGWEGHRGVRKSANRLVAEVFPLCQWGTVARLHP